MTELQDFLAGFPVSVITGADVSTDGVTDAGAAEGVVEAVSIYKKMPLV